MANVVKHRFASAKLDGADATQVQPSNWNDGHAFTGGAAGDVLIRDPADAVYGATWGAPTASTISATITGVVNDWAPGLSTSDAVILWAGSANCTLTGIAAPGKFGQRVMIKNTGAAIMTLPHFAAGSTSPNKFFNDVTSAATAIGSRGWVQYVWLSDAWYMLAHEQGAWITPPFDAADYIGWVVAAGGVQFARYRLAGRTLHWGMYVNGTVGVAAPLQRAMFGGFNMAPQGYCGFAFNFRDTGVGSGGVGWGQHTPPIYFFRDFNASPIAAGAVSVFASAFLEVI